MRIIKHGRDPTTGAHYESKCLNCKTVFEWHTGEARLKPDARDGDYYEVNCPVCSRLVTKAKLPISYGLVM